MTPHLHASQQMAGWKEEESCLATNCKSGVLDNTTLSVLRVWFNQNHKIETGKKLRRSLY